MTKSIEQALKLVPVTKPKNVDPIIQRRNRLLHSIRRQHVLLDKFKGGEKTARRWFWSNEAGQIFLGSSSFDVEFMKPLRPESGPQSGRPW